MFCVKGLVGCQVIRNSGCGFAKHIRHDRVQRDVANSESVLKPVFLTAPHGSEFVPVAGQFPQDADLLVWDETAFYQSDAKQISDLLRVLRIILVSLYSFHSFWVRDHDPNAALLQNVKYGNPILPRGLHTDVQTRILMQPIGKAVQVGIKGGK